MLSPELLGFDDGEINVFEVTPTSWEDSRLEVKLKHDIKEILVTYRNDIEELLDRSIPDDPLRSNAHLLFNLYLLGYEHVRPRQMNYNYSQRDRKFADVEESMYARTIGDIHVSRKPGDYTHDDVQRFKEEFEHPEYIGLKAMLVTYLSPKLVNELEPHCRVSKKLLRKTEPISDFNKYEYAERHFVNLFDFFVESLQAAAALKIAFPEKLPDIDPDNLDLIMRNIIRASIGFVGRLETLIEAATYAYIIMSEKAEFTENGLVITPRKERLDIETQTQPLPQIRRF